MQTDQNRSDDGPGKTSIEGPWNPGLRSPVPRELQSLCTLYRSANTFTTVEQARELAQFTGLPQEELVVFRPERLITHELLVRVAADIGVPTGSDTDDLGIHFREMVTRIAQAYVAPNMDDLLSEFAAYRAELRERIAVELASLVPRRVDESASRAARKSKSGWWTRLRRRSCEPAPHPAPQASESAVINAWRDKAASATHENRVIYECLAQVLNAIRIRHGRVLGEMDLLIDLVTDRCANLLGSERLGELIEPALDEAVRAEGYRRLPAQRSPVVMNTKGASASGKSSQRQRQVELAARIGVDWADFALISPDIFRKYLLDYDSLGEHYKYAGMLSGEELHIVDQKLDRHMAQKARRGTMSHLLIDRFRFDSFAPQSEERGSNLLTRFGSDVYLFFMVTAPHLTVERAWERGLRVGRFKSVDDLLYHNVEAFTGMPELFFTWALNRSKQVHYEFLDNDVARGETPRTIAFGANGELKVLQVCGLLNVDRYRKIDIEARSADAVYPAEKELAPERNLDFLSQCTRRLSTVDFVQASSGQVYLRVVDGHLRGANQELLQVMLSDAREGPALFATLELLGDPQAEHVRRLDDVVDSASALTLGRWSLP